MVSHHRDNIIASLNLEYALRFPHLKPMDLHHPLLSDFPEFQTTILTLKDQDPRFRSMFDEYHQVDDQVCRIEEEQAHATDCELETLKMRRVVLKDALYHKLRLAGRALETAVLAH